MFFFWDDKLFFFFQDKDIFDSKKKLRIMSANGLEHKLSGKQQELLEVNKGLFNLFSNQVSCFSFQSIFQSGELRLFN